MNSFQEVITPQGLEWGCCPSVNVCFDCDDLSQRVEFIVLQQSQRKRNKAVRFLEEPLSLACEWDECDSVFEQYEEFVNHVNGHIVSEDISEGKYFMLLRLLCIVVFSQKISLSVRYWIK